MLLLCAGVPDARPYAGETDGPVGAVAIARTLVQLGKKVTFVVDRDSLVVLEAARGCHPETASLPMVE